MNASEEQPVNHDDASSSAPSLHSSGTQATRQHSESTVDHTKRLSNSVVDTLCPGDTLGNYRLLEIVGEGGFGVVWRADDLRLHRAVAVKIAKRHMTSPADSSGFFREARAAAQLEHPHIVGVFDVGEDRGVHYIVSRFVAGQSLSRYADGRAMSCRQAADLCRRIARAVAHAHDNGIVHRDLKPSNILIDTTGEPHVLDFGLAKLEQSELTYTGDDAILGTPAYMSPEQACGNSRGANAGADVYSLGIILFQLLTGELPFRGTFHAVVLQHIETPAPSVRTFDAKIPIDLDTIVLKCLEKSPLHRFRDAAELADELSRFQAGESLSFKPIGPTRRFVRWFLNNPVVAKQTTGIVFTVFSVLLLSWGCMGLVMITTGLVEVKEKLAMIKEIAATMAFIELPALLVGIGILRSVKGAVLAGAVISIVGAVLAFGGATGVLYKAHAQGQGRSELFGLLAIFAGSGALLATATLIVERWHRRNNDKL